MDKTAALGVPKGAFLRLVQQYEKFPAGTLWVAEQPVDLGDVAFITAKTAAGQGDVPEGKTETLPADYWELSNGSTPPSPAPAPVPPPATLVAAVEAAASQPPPESNEPAPWDVDDGEVAEAFQQCASNSEVNRRLYKAYLTVNPPFDDAQLRELLGLVKHAQGEAWDDQTAARMYYAFTELNARHTDPIVFEICPALTKAREAEIPAGEKPKGKGKSKSKKAAEEPTGQASLVPTGVINAERELQGLPRTTDVPAMAADPPLAAYPKQEYRPAVLSHVGTPTDYEVEARALAGTILREVSGLSTEYAYGVLDQATRIVRAALAQN